MIIGTALCFSCTDATAKWLGSAGGVDPMQTLGARYVGSFLITLLLLNPRRVRPRFLTKKPGLQILRSLSLVASTACSYHALRALALTDMTTITFASPLIIPLMAIPFLGEKIGPRRVTAILVGFAGVLLVTRPGFHAMPWQAVLPVVGAILNAFYSIATRKLAASDPPETTMLYTSLAGSLISLPFMLSAWRAPGSLLTWALLGAMGLLGAMAHWLLIQAHKRAPATTLAPFTYIQLLGAVAIAYPVFHEIPDLWTLAGGMVIIASGLYVLYRERVRGPGRDERSSLTTPA
jgi:drug/metabolite transporter (DMT)-like permease